MELLRYLEQYDRLAVAFSGGADSSYLLYAAKTAGVSVTAYYVNAEFQPEFERRDAVRLADELGVPLRIIGLSVLADALIASNPPDRCYHCKRKIFTSVLRAAREDGFETVADGTNASDSAADRPGMKALAELSVISPLRECGLTKTRIRELSRGAGLFTADKPAYACLATRIKTGEPITAEKLSAVERAEDHLRSLGFSDLRVRLSSGNARIQLPEGQTQKFLSMRADILAALKNDFSSVSLDLETR